MLFATSEASYCFGSGMGLVVDGRHLALPPVPGVVISHQFAHEMCDVAPTRLAGVEDGAADGGRINLILGNFRLIGQAVGTDYAPFQRAVSSTDFPAQEIGSTLIIGMWRDGQTN